MTPIDPLVRLNVSGHLLPIRLKSEPETVHVHAHGLTLVFFADLRVISTEQTGGSGVRLRQGFGETSRPDQKKNDHLFYNRAGRRPPLQFLRSILTTNS